MKIREDESDTFEKQQKLEDGQARKYRIYLGLVFAYYALIFILYFIGIINKRGTLYMVVPAVMVIVILNVRYGKKKKK